MMHMPKYQVHSQLVHPPCSCPWWENMRTGGHIIGKSEPAWAIRSVSELNFSINGELTLIPMNSTCAFSHTVGIELDIAIRGKSLGQGDSRWGIGYSSITTLEAIITSTWNDAYHRPRMRIIVSKRGWNCSVLKVINNLCIGYADKGKQHDD